MRLLLLLPLLLSRGVAPGFYPQESDCTVFPRSSDISSYWDALSNCEPCIDTPGCKFCMSSLQCESAADSALYCGDEIVSKNECPVLPVEICQDDSCAWCGSSDKCTVANNTNSLSDLVGDVCQEDDVGSPIVFEGSNSHSQNGKGADILLRSGNGTSSVGGWGGDIQLSSGNGAGGASVYSFRFSTQYKNLGMVSSVINCISFLFFMIVSNFTFYELIEEPLMYNPTGSTLTK